MNTKLEIAFFVYTGIVILAGAIWTIVTEKRLKRFFLGRKAKDLEDTIIILDEEGDGLVISSLYSRERMSIFAKPVKNGKSEYELSTEEKEALTRAEVK